MYSLLCVVISEYSNNIDFISMGKAKIGPKGASSKLGAGSPLPPLGASSDQFAAFTLYLSLSVCVSDCLPVCVCVCVSVCFNGADNNNNDDDNDDDDDDDIG